MIALVLICLLCWLLYLTGRVVGFRHGQSVGRAAAEAETALWIEHGAL